MSSEEEVVPFGLLFRLIDMAKFRDLIVHNYARIDKSVVFGILKRRLGDFAFVQAIARHLEVRQQASDAVE